ncbi:MAG: 7TM-DISM domain-containing protein, partial [Salinivirgaceae bacterium]
DDENGSLSAEEAYENRAAFQIFPYESIQIPREGVMWLLFSVRNESSDTHWILENAMKIELMELFLQQQGSWQAKQKSGNQIPYSNRVVNTRNPAFQLQLERGESRDILIRLYDYQSASVRLELIEEESFWEDYSRETLFLGLAFGFFAALIIYNSIIYLFDRDRAYLFYSLLKSGYRKDGRVYLSGSVKLDFDAYDVHAGVNTIYYSIDGAPFKKFDQPIDLNQEKEYTIRFYAIDNVGNAEETNKEVIFIDKSNPQTSIKIEGDRHENVVSGRSTILIESEEEGSGVKGVFYRINENEIKPYKYPLKTSWFNEGEYTLSFYGIDHVGNKEDWNTFTFYVDKTPPVIVEEIMGNTFMANGVQYSSGRSKFKITTMDNKAGVKTIHYKVGAGEEHVYEGPFYLKGNSGNLNVKTWAFDNVNNKSEGGSSNQKRGASYVDLAGPVLSHNFVGAFSRDRDTIFIAPKTKIKLVAADKESGTDRITYKINDGGEVQYEEAFTVDQSGLHTIFFTGFDKVGNSNHKDFFFVVDDVSPRIHVNFSVEPIGSKTALSKKIDVYPNHLQLFLSATDDLAGLKHIVYKINDGKISTYGSAIDVFESGRDYKVFIKATDKLGNIAEENIEFSIN